MFCYFALCPLRYPDPDKFPHGLKPLIDYVHSLGMEFGLWCEPGMVNPNSNLYREHADWEINFPGGRARQGIAQKPSCGGAQQSAEKTLAAVILRSRRRRRISHCLENTQGEIRRFAQNDSSEAVFRSL